MPLYGKVAVTSCRNSLGTLHIGFHLKRSSMVQFFFSSAYALSLRSRRFRFFVRSFCVLFLGANVSRRVVLQQTTVFYTHGRGTHRPFKFPTVSLFFTFSGFRARTTGKNRDHGIARAAAGTQVGLFFIRVLVTFYFRCIFLFPVAVFAVK